MGGLSCLEKVDDIDSVNRVELDVEHLCSLGYMSATLAEPKVALLRLIFESVLLDGDLFVKYSSPERAFRLLREALDRSPRSVDLREKMREICVRLSCRYRGNE